jgi:hypothetical protein
MSFFDSRSGVNPRILRFFLDDRPEGCQSGLL